MRGKRREEGWWWCRGIGRSDKMWQWAHWLAGWLLLYTPITQSPCPPRHFNLIPPDPRRRERSTTRLRGEEKKQESGTEPSHKILFPASFFFLLSTYVDGSLILSLKMAAPSLITFCFCRCTREWTYGPGRGLRVNCVYMPASAQQHYFWLD